MIRRLATAVRRSLYGGVCEKSLSEHAKDYRAQLVLKILPYWLKTIDPSHGGFLLSDDAVKGRSAPKEKQLATQARMVWAFSHAHLHELDNQSCPEVWLRSSARWVVLQGHGRSSGLRHNESLVAPSGDAVGPHRGIASRRKRR